MSHGKTHGYFSMNFNKMRHSLYARTCKIKVSHLVENPSFTLNY